MFSRKPKFKVGDKVVGYHPSLMGPIPVWGTISDVSSGFLSRTSYHVEQESEPNYGIAGGTWYVEEKGMREFSETEHEKMREELLRKYPRIS